MDRQHANEESRKHLSKQPTSQKTTCEHLEELATSFIQAINTRNFQADVPPWNQLSDTFQVDCGTGARAPTSDKSSAIEAHRQLAAANPEFQIFVEGMDTTVNEKTGAAQVVMNGGSTGTPGVTGGMERRSVTILEFRKFGGRWICVRESTMSGIGMME